MFLQSKDKNEPNLKINYNNNYNNNSQSINGKGIYKSNGFDYQANLLNKKRKLDNDLKNGNIMNFNKVLNNAVMNSSKNNDNELIPSKIEFKLSHILKGEKKVSEKEKTNQNSNMDNKSLNNNTKYSDSDNTSDITKTSSIDDKQKNILLKDNIGGKHMKDHEQVSLFKNNSEHDLLKGNNSMNINEENNKNLNKQSNSRKNSCVSNSSDKASAKPHKNYIFHDNYVDWLLEWKRPSHVGSGLNNMGNTCFLNSVLQSLLYTPGLINYFSHSEHRKKCNPKGTCLLCEFHCLVELSKTNKISSLTPKNILNNLRIISKNIKIGRQEDAHEFLLYLLDSLEKSCKTYVNSTKNSFIVSNNPLDNDNLIQKLFGGRLASCVICLKCKNVSKKVDQYLDISIVRNFFNYFS